ncbi:hypothetical protein C7474_0271 [Microbacterium telephonicum]|uniref:Lipoprotein LpqN n=2 Tax=Microbacterium telephonicum TaxID=1714841 RepID=A0A498CAN6_9MICO|nr:hypothetical protein C7474_0271 [Microbacterium telephonicum]
MPTCDQIMDAAATAELFDSAIVPITGIDGLDPQGLPGPVAQAALASASNRVSCMWGIPNSDGGFHGVVAELDPTTRAGLVAALDASDYERSTVAGAPTWGTDVDDVMGYSVSYTIDGDAWVIVLGTLFFHDHSAPVTERALAALRAANA